MQEDNKEICVVIDTNILVSNSSLLLKTPLGSALLYILKRSNGRIGLPEIIEDEVIKHTIRVGRKAIEEINSSFKIIEILMGGRSSYDLPDESQLEKVARERFTELDPLIIRIPFTFDHAKSALRRINEESQPNWHKNQQFKDSAIWEAILSILNSYTVYFITNDNAFYKSRSADTGKLADNLLEDCRKIGGNVYIYKDLDSCLKVLRENVPALDERSIIQEIDHIINPNLVRERISETGFEIISLAIDLSSVSAFLTEAMGKLALTFKIKYHLYDVQNRGASERKDAILTAAGDCLYEPDTNIISDVRMDFERMTWLEPTGELGRRGTVYMSASMGDDNRIEYTFREPLR